MKTTALAAFEHGSLECDDPVVRAPRPAADPLVGPFEQRKSRTRGSGADGCVHRTFIL